MVCCDGFIIEEDGEEKEILEGEERGWVVKQAVHVTPVENHRNNRHFLKHPIAIFVSLCRHRFTCARNLVLKIES